MASVSSTAAADAAAHAHTHGARPAVPKLATTDAAPMNMSYSDMSSLLRQALYSTGTVGATPAGGEVGVSSLTRACTPTSTPITPADATALLVATRFDLDQHLLVWLAQPATQSLLRDLSADVAAGREVDLVSVCARVRTSTHTQASAASLATGAASSAHGMKLMSPRRNLAMGGSPNTPTGGSRRPTPPMSPTHTHTHTHGVAGSNNRGPMSPLSGRSPPSSPRHFTFGGGPPSAREVAGADDSYPSPAAVASHGAVGLSSTSPMLSRSPRGASPQDAFPIATAAASGEAGGLSGSVSPPGVSISPSSPLATHGIGIALNVMSPSATAAQPTRSGAPLTTTGSTPPSGHRYGASAPAVLVGVDSPRDRESASSPLPPLPSPQPSPTAAASPIGMTKGQMIAAARAEAFPVSSPTSAAPTRSRSTPSPTSGSPSGPRAVSPVSLTAGDSKEREIEDFVGTSKEDDAPTVRSPEDVKAAAARSPVPRKSPTAAAAAAAAMDAASLRSESKVESSPSDRRGATNGAGATISPPGRSAVDSAFNEVKGADGYAAHAIPPFYVPGAGGRGRGRAISSDALQERLPAILDLFRRHNAATKPPAPCVRARMPLGSKGRDINRTGSAKQLQGRTASGRNLLANDDEELVDVPTEVRVEVASVSLSWDDANLGIPVEHFAAVAKTLCGFPSFFAAPLFRRVRAQFGGAANGNGTIPVPADMFVEAGPAEAASKGVPNAASRASSNERQRKPSIDVATVRQRVISLVLTPNAPDADNPDERDTAGVITLPQFLEFWRHEIAPYDHVDRFFRLVKRRVARYIEPLDFMPFMEELLAFHPGLAFLESTPEFQEKYARTVIARIFYVLDPLARKCIDQRSLRRSKLLEAFHTVDVEEDINLVNDYFSYEHFYVLYCRFWELDSDHDFFLTRSDLNKMTDLTRTVLDRVFQQAGRPFTSGARDKMSFEDFIVFFMSEEDKTSEAAIRFWFNVCDLDGDGVLTANELRYFFKEQEQRMRELGMEVIKFEDVLCQMHDLLKPVNEGRIMLADFLHPERCKLTGVLFSAMFNLSKFQAFEARDPILVKQELNLGGVSQWDRYAQAEYARLASEEEDAAAAANTVTGSGGFMSTGAYIN